MKRKKTVAASAQEGKTPEVQARVLEEKPFSPWDAVQICLFSVLLFLAMTVQTARMSVLLPVLALALSIGRGPLRRLRERFCVPVVGFTLFLLASGAASLYAQFGGYAVKELYKLTASSALAVIVLTRFDKKHVRGLLWGIAAVCAVLSLICTDGASGGPLYEPFLNFMGRLGAPYDGVIQNPWGSRVNGIYNDANITAGILALGAFCGLHLTLTGQRRWERLLSCWLTGMSGMGFFLAMSRGAILCFGLALLLYLAAVGNGERTRLFFLIALNVLVTIALSIPISRVTAAGTLLPDAGTFLCGLPVWLLYDFPALWAARKLAGHGRVLAGFAAVLVLCAGIYGVIAVRTTGPYVFSADARLFRTVELQPGEYTLTVEMDGESLSAYVTPEGGEWVPLASAVDGPGLEYLFTVDQAGPISFLFSGNEGDTLCSAVLSDGTELHLGYPLLPRFLAERMQNSLFESISFTYRVQYDKDGWELFKRSPLLGKGLGSTEGLLTSIQPFFYESLYLHNHVLQVLCDCGLLGGIPFLVFLLGAAWLLVHRLRKSWKEGGDPLVAALLGAWVMMNAHGLMELNFSIRAYQCVAFVLLLMPVLLYGQPLWEAETKQEGGERDGERTIQRHKKLVRWSGLAVAVCLWAYLGGFSTAMESHRIVEREMAEFSTSSAREFMETTERWIRRDLFDREQNQLNYVGNAVVLDDTRYNGNMLRYVKALRKSGTYTACTGLAEYYYLPRGELEEVFACSREAVAQEASTKDAWNQQIEFYRDTLLPQMTEEDAQVYLDGVLALKAYLEEYSQGRQEEIQLTEENAAFLERAVKARNSGLEGMAALMYLTISQE